MKNDDRGSDSTVCSCAVPLTFGSLFAGIGGIDLGFERAGLQCKWQVEINPYGRSILARHWPNVRQWDDVRTWPQPDTESVDVIVGGFPCQDISNSGHRVGIGGERSGLWSEFARIIRDIGPRYVVVENVAALAVRGLDVVLRDLAILGFDAEWGVLPACAMGAPHTRERLFIVANAKGSRRFSPPHTVGRGRETHDGQNRSVTTEQARG